MIVNGAADPDSQTAHQAYDRFLLCGPGAVLVSPSFSTGWDFKWDLAEWQILSKIAFPDTRGKVMQRRCADDRTYSNYIAAQDLQQSAGRIVRSEEDRGMTLIIDDSWSWFGSIASEFLAKSFKVRREDELPRPLEKL
jgi:Rad3-related DNA helicase